VVVLVAAAVHDLATAAGLIGPQAVGLQLTADDGQASVVGSATTRCRLCKDLGAVEREQLVAGYGTDDFTAVQAAAEEVLLRHTAVAGDDGQAHPTYADQALRMARGLRATWLSTAAEVFGEDDL